MIRKIACALALVSASYAGFVQALGLGEATVTSSLNQPLRAEIQLVSAEGLSEEEILPGLATREEFLKAGIDRVYFLSDVRFEIATGANGKPAVILTTKKPVREPFLNFLVEVIWPSGRLLREYALLIDPPLFAEDKVIAASEAPTPVPSTSNTSPTVQPSVVARGDQLNVSTPSQPRSGSLSGAGSYGPTKTSDTLWEIALKARPDRSVSPQQVMLAIQDLNPNAFIDNNINKMKEGQILRLPSKSQVQSRSAATAIDEVIAQNAALRKPRTQTPTSVSSSKSAAPSTKAAKSSGDELKLVVADKNSEASDSASSDPSGTASAGAASSEELTLTLEKLDKANLENEELGEKVGALEDQLETLQRLLTLKNDQLAGLQAQMRANDLAEAEAQEGALSEDGMPSEELAAEVQDHTAANDESVESLSGADVSAGEEMPVEELAEDQSLAQDQQEQPSVSAEPQAIVEDSPVTPSGKTVQDQILHALVSNPVYQAAAAAILVVLLALLWMLSRRRSDDSHQADEETDEHYEQVETFETDEEEQAAFDEDEPGEDDSTEASSDESEDVIAEADVYIAYGRLDQAASILEQGISADPVRVDYRLKLLEVYRDGLEEAAFDKQMNELEAIQDEDAMARAAVLREELMSKLKEQDADPEPEDVEHLLDEQEAEELMQPDDNNFDFDSVDEPGAEVQMASENASSMEDVVDEVAEEIDLDSDELDIDLDIDLDLDSVEESVKPDNHDPIEYEKAEINLDEEMDAAVEEIASGSEDSVAEDDSLDLELDDGFDLASDSLDTSEELDDIELDEDLDVEAEIDLDLDMAEDLGVDVSTEESASLDEIQAETDERSSEDLSTDAEVEADDSHSEPELDEDVAEDALNEAADEVEVIDTAGLEEESLEADEIDAASLGLDDSDEEMVVTDETLDEAVSALGDADEFEPELSEDEDFDFLEGTDEASTKLDLARAYIDMGDTDGAKEILQEVQKDGSPEQQAQAKELIDSLGG